MDEDVIIGFLIRDIEEADIGAEGGERVKSLESMLSENLGFWKGPKETKWF